MANRLADQSSPYLLQHAANPVDWYPWGEEALALARREDRPILLSIGYSACHWCHVMERESFEDEAVAELMNRLFVNIKVDREERPDIDSIYMKAVQAMTGQGGWPLTAFLTPEGVPFFGGTYFPPEPRHGLPSFRQVLTAAANAYEERRDQVLVAGERLRSLLDRSSTDRHAAQSQEGVFSQATVEHVVRFARQGYDPKWGGFGSAPKFPQPVVLDLLLRSRAEDDTTGSGVDMALHTLSQMARGGMRDHLGGGFHRYSVDERWLVPHFEKMLYDNALLARSYADAAALAGDEALGEVATSILDDVIDDLGAPEGAFYSARDADSEGEEGAFYLWTPAQVAEVLDGPTATLFARCYDVSEGGNFEGRNILHLPHDLDAVARSESMSREELDAVLGSAGAALKAARWKREAPLLDDKILTSWNGMTIRALAEVGSSRRRPDYLERAESAAGFLLDAVRTGDGLFHVHAGGTGYVDGFLEDYAAMGNALISLYESTLDPGWLDEARWCADRALEGFWDDKAGIFYDARTGAESLLVRPRDIMDNATPSGNSLAVELLVRLSSITGDQDQLDVATRVLERELGVLERYPTAVARLAVAGIRAYTPKLEVALIGSAGQVSAMLDETHRYFHRNRVIVGGDPEDSTVAGLPVLEGRLADPPRAFVCRGSTCLEPVDTPEALAAQLRDA